MPDPAPPPGHDGQPVNPDVKRERTDVNVRAVMYAGAGLVVAGLILHFTMGWLFTHFKDREEEKSPPLPRRIAEERKRQQRDMLPRLEADPRREMEQAPPPLRRIIGGGKEEPVPVDVVQRLLRREEELRREEGQPRLQTNPEVDMEALKVWEDRRLSAEYDSSYGWVNRKKGVVHIPIAEAMRLLANPREAEAHGIRWRPPQGKTKRGGQP